MKDTLSYAVVSDGEGGLPAAMRKLRAWIDNLPDRAKVRIVLKGTVKEAEEAAEMSKTSDMFKAGEVRDGVQRKGRVHKGEREPRGRRGGLQAAPARVDAEDGTGEEAGE